MSAHSLDDPAFSEFVSDELARSGADPALVVFELTETALLRDEEAALRFVGPSPGGAAGSPSTTSGPATAASPT